MITHTTMHERLPWEAESVNFLLKLGFEVIVNQVVVGQIFPVVTIMEIIKNLSDNMVDSKDIR